MITIEERCGCGCSGESQVKSYLKTETPAHWIAGFLYYTSAIILWTASAIILVAFLLMLFYSPLFVLRFVGIILFTGGPEGLLMIFGFCLWLVLGFVLFRWQKRFYDWDVGKSDGIVMWSCTIAYNAFQASFIFGFIGNAALSVTAIGVWNLIVTALALFALFFELQEK